jgi:hypothetical protein
MSSGPVNGSATNDPTPTFQFSSSESGATFECRYEGEGFSACSGARSDTPASPLSDGPQTFHLRAIDAANNKSGVLSRSFAVDTVAPKVTIKGPGKTKTKRRRARVTFLLRAVEQVNRRCRVDLKRFKSCSWRYRTPRLMPGIHRLTVEATDRAGNVGAKRKWFKIVRRGPRGRSHMRKLGIRDLVELVHYAIRKGLIEP